MDYDQQVYLLSRDFITDYPLSTHPELMYKNGRPYSCLLIQTHDDYFICVPFRSSISHHNCYHFTSTVRSKRTKSGLDYSKIVIITDGKYIDSVSVGRKGPFCVGRKGPYSVGFNGAKLKT